MFGSKKEFMLMRCLAMSALALFWCVNQIVAQEPGKQLLRIGDGRQWIFQGGDWTESPEGVIRPPDRRNLQSRAFYKGGAFSDLTVEFEYNANYRETGTGNAGLILRATDAGHFYYVHLPWGGQQLRAKHFWAGIAKAGSDGYVRNLKFQMVPSGAERNGSLV